MTDSNVIDLKPREHGPRRRVRRKERCPHMSVELDETSRTVECMQCGRVVDAFDILHGYIVKEIDAFEDLRHWSGEVTELHAKAELLRREIRNLQAKKRRLERKVADGMD